MISNFLPNQIFKIQYIFQNGGVIMIVIFGLGLTIWTLLLLDFFEKGYRKNNSPHKYTKTPRYHPKKKNCRQWKKQNINKNPHIYLPSDWPTW